MDSDKCKVDGEEADKVDYTAMVNNLTQDGINAEIEFIGNEPVTIKTTNAQEIYNFYQMYPNILVFDLRDSHRYKDSHLKCSVNLPIDVFNSDSFINFDPVKIEKEHLTLEVDKKAFKIRKRSMCFIIAHQTCAAHIFDYIPDLFDKAKLEKMKLMFSAEDILATRNSFLLHKALKKDRTREVYICRNSFTATQGKYPFMCRFSGSSLYLDPKKTNGYPSEILDRRLYLGDHTHATNETIIHNLGITHILNVTDNIANEFEESKSLQLTYQRINIQDNEDVPIELSFSLAYDYIDKALSPKKTAKARAYKTRFDLIQNYKNGRKASKSLVFSCTKTSDLVLDLVNGTVENCRNPTKDKAFEIDGICEAFTHSSNNQNRVLVHCAMGRSRSATMVIMYLMMKFQLDYEIAYSIVKSRREVVDPNEGFVQKLKDFELKLYQKPEEKIPLRTKALTSSKNIEKWSSSGSGTDSSEDLLESRKSFDI